MARNPRTPAMPSKRPQWNVRLDPETEERIPRLKAAASSLTKLEVGDSKLVRLAMIALEEEYIRLGVLPTPKKGKKGR